MLKVKPRFRSLHSVSLFSPAVRWNVCSHLTCAENLLVAFSHSLPRLSLLFDLWLCVVFFLVRSMSICWRSPQAVPWLVELLTAKPWLCEPLFLYLYCVWHWHGLYQHVPQCYISQFLSESSSMEGEGVGRRILRISYFPGSLCPMCHTQAQA